MITNVLPRFMDTVYVRHHSGVSHKNLGEIAAGVLPNVSKNGQKTFYFLSVTVSVGLLATNPALILIFETCESVSGCIWWSKITNFCMWCFTGPKMLSFG